MNAHPILLQRKYSRVILRFAEKTGLSPGAALEVFYCSQLYPLLREGVSDLHCMSDEYLVTELEMEYQERDGKGKP